MHEEVVHQAAFECTEVGYNRMRWYSPYGLICVAAVYGLRAACRGARFSRSESKAEVLASAAHGRGHREGGGRAHRQSERWWAESSNLRFDSGSINSWT
jgi:hypothetical protein